MLVRWAVSILLLAAGGRAEPDGNLQLHFLDAGQGDAAVLISPLGEAVLFDNGVDGYCQKTVTYLGWLGVTALSYHVASHYHSDHIGCTEEVLAAFPLRLAGFDRGGHYGTLLYRRYSAATGPLRRTAEPGTTLTLDEGSDWPVRIEIAAANGDGAFTENENDLSVVAVIRYGSFDAEIGGDLSGYRAAGYLDIESRVAPKIGQVEVYKVHHHASRYSTNEAWLAVVKPKVAIVSVGDRNRYGHPSRECLERLHQAGVRTYWTSRGAGALPEPGFDTVGGHIAISVPPGGKSFTVTHSGTESEVYRAWESAEPGTDDMGFTGLRYDSTLQ